MDRAEYRAKFKARGDELEKPHPFTVPGFGPVQIKLMSAGRATRNRELVEADSKRAHIVLAAAMCLCDDAGELLYDVTNVDDLAELERMDPATLTKIVTEANRLNAQSQEGAEEAGNV